MESSISTPVLDWIKLAPLQQGALIIAAIVLVLTFFLVVAGKAKTGIVLSFMGFALIVLLSAVVVDPNSAIAKSWLNVGDTSTPEEVVSKEPDEIKEGTGVKVEQPQATDQPQLRVYVSDWFIAKPNQVYDIEHNIGVEPIGANLWYRKAGSPQKHLMDGIFEGRGVGSFVMDVTATTARIATGDSVSSGYGNTYSHWVAVDQGQPQNSQPRELQLVLFYFQ